MYKVINKEGQVSEPLDIVVLQKLYVEQHIAADQILIDANTGQTLVASQLFSDQLALPLPVLASAPASTPQTTTQEDASVLGPRIGAYLIDLLCSIPLVLIGLVPIVGLIVVPLMVLYWLSRDSFFGNQSIGKRVLGLKVITLNGSPFGWGKSALRNLVYLPLLLQMVPVVGWLLTLIPMGLLMTIEIVMVFSTQRRMGDHLGQTKVVRA